MAVWVQCMLINGKAGKDLTECNKTQPQWLFNFSCDIRKPFINKSYLVFILNENQHFKSTVLYHRIAVTLYNNNNHDLSFTNLYF